MTMYHITYITRKMTLINVTSDLNSTASVSLRRWRKEEDGFVVPMIQRETGSDRGSTLNCHSVSPQREKLSKISSGFFNVTLM